MKDLLKEDGSLRPTETEPSSKSKAQQAKSRAKKLKKRIKFKRKKKNKESVMDLFFKQVATIQSEIAKIKAATAELDELCEQAIHATKSQDENAISDKVKNVIKTTNKQAKVTKYALYSLEEETKEQKEKGKLNESDERIRHNLCNTLYRKYCDELRRYQNAQQVYKRETVKKMKRQIRVVKPNVSEDQLDTFLEHKGGRDALYKELVLSSEVSDDVMTTFDNVSAKHKDILKLESSMTELHQMFIDVALLTEQQGEMLDQIEFHVKNAGDHVEQGNDDMVKAIRYLKKYQKKKMFLGVIVVVVVVVVIVVVL